MQDVSDDDIDIQKELEAKFDELFGTDQMKKELELFII